MFRANHRTLSLLTSGKSFAFKISNLVCHGPVRRAAELFTKLVRLFFKGRAGDLSLLIVEVNKKTRLVLVRKRFNSDA